MSEEIKNNASQVQGEKKVQGDVQPPKTQGDAQGDTEAQAVLNRLIELSKTDYTAFVQTLAKEVSKDNLFPKLRALLLKGREDGKPDDEVFSFSDAEEEFVTVAGLIPTQNEIDRDKSLAFNATYPKMFTKISPEEGKIQISNILTEKGVKINNLPIVLFKHGGLVYILDGHHRWSGVHALNKAGKIAAIYLESSKGITPERALAAVQLSIATSQKNWGEPGDKDTGFPSNKAGSADTNILLKSSNPTTIKWLEENASEDFIALVKEVKKEIEGNPVDKKVVIDFIMKNLYVMQEKGFLSGSPTREVMPQTDGTPVLDPSRGGDQNLWKEPLKTGKVNFIEDSLKTNPKWIKTFEQFKGNR